MSGRRKEYEDRRNEMLGPYWQEQLSPPMGGRGQEAAAGGRVHAHGGPAADGREDGQWELLQ